MLPNQIIDPYFRVHLDLDASSPNPSIGIWRAQHVCVADTFSPDDSVPSNAAAAIIDHQFKPKHWSVLEFGFAVLHFGGFPHDTVMQMVRHQDSAPLCQSFRYTGAGKMRECGNGNRDLVEELFYVPPIGRYKSRNGFHEVRESDREFDIEHCFLSARAYTNKLIDGFPEESARRLLAAGYRQNFVMAGSIRSIFHWLDQRTLADSQLEAQILARMALEELKKWNPELFEWYEQNRAGRNLLSP